LINRFKIKPKQMTLSFFDYVYLGKGDIKKISRETKIPTKQLKELRKAFDYWYPNDHRHTYPLHLPNHLSFFIFAHAAIFPEKYWPKKISFHGMIECGGEKMSKSRGNVITLLDVKNKFGADVFRAYLATATSVEGDFNWITEDVNAMKKTVANLYEILEKAAKVRGTGKTDMLGNAFISKFEGWIEAATKNIAEMKHREYSNIVIYDITNAYKKLLKGADKNEIKAVNAAVIEKWIKLLCPVMPHIAEELWSKLGKTNLVSAESWPVADKKKIDKKLESAEMMIDKVSEDINNIVKLVGKKPKSIELFIAPEWKFGLFRIVAKNLAEGKRDVKIIIGEAMKDSEVKKHGQDAAKIIPRLASEPGKIPGVILGEREEIKLLASMQKVLEKEFSCKFKIMAAGKSHEEKAMQALPGKPAIVVRT
jgi:leucyl-tRNA synthetase